jgi:hypothetical protein
MERERICRGCGTTEELTRLERCGICAKFFCADCANRAIGGRKFCSAECAKAYYFHGEPDDDDTDEDVRAEE